MSPRVRCRAWLLAMGLLAPAAAAASSTAVLLPFGDAPDTLSFSPVWSHRSADLGILMDCTGDMGNVLSSVQASYSSVASQLASVYPDLRIGIAEFEDWPCGTYGPVNGVPFRLDQRCTSSLTTAGQALNALAVLSGGDADESGYDALHCAVTGEGESGAGCATVAAFDTTVGYVAGLADGNGGGMGFRSGVATPVILIITSAVFHDSADYSFTGPVGRPRVLTELFSSRDRLAAIRTDPSNAGTLAELRELSDTSSTVTPPAYGSSSTLCETGLGGAGITPVNGGCPDVFDVDGTGSGIGAAELGAVTDALDASPFTLDFVTAGTPVPPDGSSSGFVQSSALVGGSNPSFAPPPVVAGGGATLLGSFASGSADIRLVLQNTTVPPADTMQRYPLYLALRANGVPVVRDTIVIEVPTGTGVPPEGASAAFRLEPASSNPFEGTLPARLSLPAAGRVRVSVWDAAGRHLRTLVDSVLPAGAHTIIWDGLRDDGTPASAGIYFLRAAWGDRRASLKVARLR